MCEIYPIFRIFSTNAQSNICNAIIASCMMPISAGKILCYLFGLKCLSFFYSKLLIALQIARNPMVDEITAPSLFENGDPGDVRI